MKIETFIPEYKVTTNTTKDDIFKYYVTESEKLGFPIIKGKNTSFQKLAILCVCFGNPRYEENKSKNIYIKKPASYKCG